MMTLVPRQKSDFIALLLGGFIALLLAPAVAESSHWLQDWYDKRSPPVEAQMASHEVIAPDSLRVRLLITRQRDCMFVRLVAFTGGTSGDMNLALTVRREDGADPVSYPTGITVLSRPWVISPVYGKRLILIGHYECGNRLVRTTLIDEVLT